MPRKKEKSPSFDDALAQLTAAEFPSEELLRALSGAGVDRQADLERAWRALDADRRARLVADLDEMARTDVEVEFSLVFRLGLRDADARVRLTSALGLWECELPEVIAPLLHALRSDVSDDVRAAAAQSLGHFLYAAEVDRLNGARGREIYEALLQALRRAPDESPLYQRALESIAYVGSVDVDFFLRSAIASDDAGLKLSAVIGMGRSENQAYQLLVRDELQHVSPAVRREAARAAGELEDVDAVKDLAELIDDPDHGVRDAAIEALAQVGGLEAKRILESVAAAAEDDVKAKAEEALQMYEMLHGEFDFNVNIFDEESRTSFHTVNAAKAAKAVKIAKTAKAGRKGSAPVAPTDGE
jgi:HEAT repeat protein